MTTRLAVVTWIAVVLLALGCNPKAPQAKVKILSEGTGEPSKAPLEPAIAGTRSRDTRSQDGQGHWQRWAGSLSTEFGEVLVKEFSGTPQLGQPNLGAGTALYRFTADGLVLVGSDAPLSDVALPVLMVPPTVRVGMKWESDLGDGKTFNRQEVTAHTTATLPFGKAELWAIGEYSGANIVVTRWYAEGVGRVGTGRESSEWKESYLTNVYDEWVLPETAQTHREPAVVYRPLENILEIEDHGDIGHEIWSLSADVVDGKLYAYMLGWNTELGFTKAIDHDYCARLDASPTWLAAGQPGCPTFRGREPIPTSNTAYLEVPKLIQAPMIIPGTTKYIGVNRYGQSSGKAYEPADEHVLTGWAVDGVANILRFNGSFSREAYADGGSEITLVDAVPQANIEPDAHFNSHWIGPAQAAAGATLHFARIAYDGRVQRFTIGPERVSGDAWVGVMPGAVSVVTYGAERLAYSITTDGRVFSLRVEQATGEVAIKALGAVRVEEPGGAYEFEGVVVHPTEPQTVYVAATATSKKTVPKWRSGIFKAKLTETSEPVVSAPSFAVSNAHFGTTGNLLTVCWPSAEEPLIRAGWTLDEQPVEVSGPFRSAKNCAVVVKPPSVGPAPEQRVLSGTLPGIGKVTLGTRRNYYSRSPALQNAVLRDGTIISFDGAVFDADGLPFSVLPSFADTRVVRDLGGYGLWAQAKFGVLETRYNVGGGIVVPTCPPDGPRICYFSAVVAGGGAVLYRNLNELQVLRPGRPPEDLPAPQVSLLRSGVLLSDGRLCDVRGSAITCVDATGQSTTTTLSTSVKLLDERFWPLSDGTFAVLNDPNVGSTHVFDPVRLEARVLDPRGLQNFVTANDGKIYAVAHSVDGASMVVEVTPTGVVDLPHIATTPGQAPIVGLVPVEGALLFSVSDGTEWTRVAR